MTWPGLVAWALPLPGQGFTLLLQRHRPDGRGQSYMFTHDPSGLNVSCYIEPVERCTTSEACRAAYWAEPSPVVKRAQDVRFFEHRGFAVIAFLVPEFQGQPVRQFDFSVHQVRDGYWIDLHISKVRFQPADRQTFLGVLEAVTFAPKPR